MEGYLSRTEIAILISFNNTIHKPFKGKWNLYQLSLRDLREKEAR
jgi:hypothetical protein